MAPSPVIRKTASANIPMEDHSSSSAHSRLGHEEMLYASSSSHNNNNNNNMNNNSSTSNIQEQTDAAAGSSSSTPVFRMDTNATTPPIPSVTTFRLYMYRVLQTGYVNLKSQWKILVAGQVLSFLTASKGAVQSSLSFDCHLSAPSLTLGLCYTLLAMVTLVSMVIKERRSPHHKSLPSFGQTAGEDALEGTLRTPFNAPHRFLGIVPLQAPAMAYLPMAIFDVYANYFTVLAFKFTTITSVTLFDALAIPSAMILSHAFLHKTYSRVHLLAVASCCVGILLNVVEDYEDDQQSASMTTTKGISLDQIYPHRTFGDTLAILGGILFGATNTYGEYAVRQLGGPYEYIGMLSFFGAGICLVQTLLLERQNIAAFIKTDDRDECSLLDTQLMLVGFIVATCTTYLGSARFLQVSDAAFFNLSLLTGDLWSVIFSIVEEGIIPGALFFIALVFIVAGVIVYEMTEEPADNRNVPIVAGGVQRKHSGDMEMALVPQSSFLSGDESAGLLPGE